MTTSTPKQVEVYAIFSKVLNINTVQGKFDGEVDIVSSWLDHLNGDYDPDSHWNPQLICENLMDSDKKIRTRIEVKPSDDSNSSYARIVQYQKVTGSFSEWIQVKQFPFDVQRLGKDYLVDDSEKNLDSCSGVVITSLHPITRITLLGKQEYCYLAQKAIRESDNWDFNQAVSINYGTYQEQTPYLRSQQYPLVKFHALIARKSQFYITNLILPLFFVTSTIFVSFTHDVEAISSRLSACATTLLTSINFRFVIHNYLPNVPYSTYLDMYSMCSIIFITLVFGWHAYSIKQLNKITYAQLDNYVLLSFATIYIVGHLLFVIFAWIIPKRRQKAILNASVKKEDLSEEKQPIELDNLLGYERSIEKVIID